MVLRVELCLKIFLCIKASSSSTVFAKSRIDNASVKKIMAVNDLNNDPLKSLTKQVIYLKAVNSNIDITNKRPIAIKV